MGIVVLLEMDDSPAVRAAGSGGWSDQEAGVRAVHAAQTAPGALDHAPELARTLCGLGTAGMLTAPGTRAHTGRQWYPPLWAERICLTCDAALRP